MKPSMYISNGFLIGALIVLGSLSQAFAGVRSVEVNEMYAGSAYSISTHTVIYGNAQQSEEMQGQNRLWGWGHGRDASWTIVRPDLGKRWQLDVKKKRYVEQNLKADALPDLSQTPADSKDQKDGPPMETRSETKVLGPGPMETLHGFSCKPYTILTTVIYESVPDKREVSRQVIYQKLWVASETGTIQSLLKEQQNFYSALSAATTGSEAENQRFQEIAKRLLTELKNPKGILTAGYMEHWESVGKITGYPIRSIFAGGWAAASVSASAPEGASQKEESLVQVDDLASGSVGGFLTGVASRWAGKKVEKKMTEKAGQRPTWVDDVFKEMGNNWLSLSMFRNETHAVEIIPFDASRFEVPLAYKKVGSL